MKTKINISWIGGHIDIMGNELADRAAKEGAMMNISPLSATMTMKTVKSKIKQATVEKWQNIWDHSATGKHLKEIEASVSLDTRNSLPPSRKMQKIFHQLRIGRGPLNDQDPIDRKTLAEKLCEHCNGIENTEHFLISCPRYENIRRNMWNNILSNAEANGVDSAMIPMDIRIISHNLHLPAKIRKNIASEIGKYITNTKRLKI